MRRGLAHEFGSNTAPKIREYVRYYVLLAVVARIIDHASSRGLRFVPIRAISDDELVALSYVPVWLQNVRPIVRGLTI